MSLLYFHPFDYVFVFSLSVTAETLEVAAVDSEDLIVEGEAALAAVEDLTAEAEGDSEVDGEVEEEEVGVIATIT